MYFFEQVELQKTSREYDKRGEFYEYKCTLFQTHFIRIQYVLAPQPTGRHDMLNILLLFCGFQKYDECQGLVN